ncbi:MAG: polymer-forming cytoskeletal protein, partial [Acidobacteriota bacterium]|nr:polymer-forming cytoskeletal protein [Acidobacteriota bacterium]
AGSLEGDVAAPRVVIAEGAFFKGRVEMRGEKMDQSRDGRRPKEPAGNRTPTPEKAVAERGGH